MKIRNESVNEFIDISSEKWREYKTPVGVYRIDEPEYLSVSKNGHRILDAKGISHYVDITKGFYLSWEAKEDQPHFVK